MRKLCLLSAGIFLLVEMTFTNLHFVHNYYQYENGLFLIAALGFGIAGLIGLGGPARVSGLMLLGITVAGSVYRYHESLYLVQLGDQASLAGIARLIQRNTNPGDLLMVYGMDWSSELPYVSHRRAIMVRGGPDDPNLQKTLRSLGNLQIGAVAMCSEARANRAEIEPELLLRRGHVAQNRTGRLFALCSRDATGLHNAVGESLDC